MCTWLELLADYLAPGGPASAFGPSHTEINPTTARRALRLFIREAIAVLKVHARPEFAARFARAETEAALRRLAACSVARVAHA
eukprot:96412-Alexandrium_andersonii.AAC.1